MYSATRNDLKQLASQIELLAKKVQDEVVSGGDYLSVANELVRTKETFVFTMGEVYALEQVSTAKGVKGVRVGNSNATKHNKRDSLGRFVKA